jgi:hypothetical protein
MPRDIHQAWAETKHSNTFNRLDLSDRQNPECLRCHVTGTPEMIAAEGASRACRACSARRVTARAARIEAAKAGAVKKGLVVRKPDEKNCTQCHNPKSRIRPFLRGDDRTGASREEVGGRDIASAAPESRRLWLLPSASCFSPTICAGRCASSASSSARSARSSSRLFCDDLALQAR